MKKYKSSLEFIVENFAVYSEPCDKCNGESINKFTTLEFSNNIKILDNKVLENVSNCIDSYYAFEDFIESNKFQRLREMISHLDNFN